MAHNCHVLRRTHGNEEISISVMRLANIIAGGIGDEEEDGINQLFLHVDISKPGQKESLHFLCGLYPDALGIHSVSLRSKTESSGFLAVPTNYGGPVFQDIDEKMRDALHSFIEERGINESLFPFLQAWLYVKDHRNLMRWFKTVGSLVNDRKQGASHA
uniref:Mitochondrial glycoprotein n=1 Tax=Solanum tuberosum TaxID=4113 RepID=M0ZKB8_SOLTU